VVTVFGGLLLIGLGILLITNNIGLLIQYGYKFFNFVGYERLIEYL